MNSLRIDIHHISLGRILRRIPMDIFLGFSLKYNKKLISKALIKTLPKQEAFLQKNVVLCVDNLETCQNIAYFLCHNCKACEFLPIRV